MFHWFQKSSNCIRKIDDLVDPRAKALAREFELEVGQIYPLSSQLNEELRANNRALVIPCVDTRTSARLLAMYSKKLAAAAALAYELTQQENVQFPKPRKKQVTDVPEQLMKILGKYGWRAGRMGSPEQYDLMGRIYDYNLRALPARVSTGCIDISIDEAYVRMTAQRSPLLI